MKVSGVVTIPLTNYIIMWVFFPQVPVPSALFQSLAFSFRIGAFITIGAILTELDGKLQTQHKPEANSNAFKPIPAD